MQTSVDLRGKLGPRARRYPISVPTEVNVIQWARTAPAAFAAPGGTLDPNRDLRFGQPIAVRRRSSTGKQDANIAMSSPRPSRPASSRRTSSLCTSSSRRQTWPRHPGSSPSTAAGISAGTGGTVVRYEIVGDPSARLSACAPQTATSPNNNPAANAMVVRRRSRVRRDRDRPEPGRLVVHRLRG